jgi:hypothetical protein
LSIGFTFSGPWGDGEGRRLEAQGTSRSTTREFKKTGSLRRHVGHWVAIPPTTPQLQLRSVIFQSNILLIP